MNHETTIIDMRTPATQPLPVIAEPAWDAVVRRERPHNRRRRGRDPLALVGDLIMWGGWLGLCVWLVSLTEIGQLVAQSLPWAGR